MKIAVFGGTGFVGSGIVEGLVEQGHAITVGTRNRSPYRASQEFETVPVDYLSADSLENFLAGQDFAINCIANIHGEDMSAAEFRRVEVDLSERIARASRCAQIPFLQLSSIIAFGRKLPDRAVDETFAGTEFEMVDRICLEREDIIKSVYKDSADYLILRPVPIIGAGDKGSTLKRIFDLYPQGKFPLVENGLSQFTFIDKRDLGEAVGMAVNAFEKIKGRTFIVGGFQISWRQIKQAFDHHDGVNRPCSSLTRAEAESILGYRTAEFISNPRLYNDQNFRKATGFYPKYSLDDAIGYYLDSTRA